MRTRNEEGSEEGTALKIQVTFLLYMNTNISRSVLDSNNIITLELAYRYLSLNLIDFSRCHIRCFFFRWPVVAVAPVHVTVAVFVRVAVVV